MNRFTTFAAMVAGTTRRGRLARGAVLLALVGLALPLAPHKARAYGVGKRLLPAQALTDPGNGDGNPYGAAFVPEGFPQGSSINIHPHDLLVSNFNSATGGQGTGTTIVSVTPNGDPPLLFFQAQPTAKNPIGLTTALGVLRNGFVIVGNVPTKNGVIVTPGSLLVVNAEGQQVGTLTDPDRKQDRLDGPWDLFLDDDGDHATMFVSCVNTGSVTRLELDVGDGTSPNGEVTIRKIHQVASGYTVTPSAAALILGPTGLWWDEGNDILYVASTGDNAIFAVPGAGHAHSSLGTGNVIFQGNPQNHLNGPLALVKTPNGHFITSNGDAFLPGTPTGLDTSNLIEFTVDGKFIGRWSIDSTAGAAFGLALDRRVDDSVRLADVNDTQNSVEILDLAVPGSE
jgi:hypothetical protein